jgi:ATP/maltotriose-dependent transcriptional regulator MalT
VERDTGLVTGARPPPGSGPVESYADPLLATKLFVPPLASTVLDRPRVVSRLAEGLRRPLTLLAAPPGWGKTTLLSAWAASIHSQQPAIAWLSLDSRDNDPARFWAYVLFALRQIRLPLTEKMVAALKARTEGWIVGLQLAALAMRDRDDLASFYRRFQRQPSFRCRLSR